MSRKSTISISLIIEEGADGFKQLIADASGLRKIVKSTVTEADNLGNRMLQS